MFLNLILFTVLLQYDVFLTQKDFLCNEVAFAFCLKEGFNFKCDDFSASVKYEKFSDGVLKVYVSEPTSSIEFRFKDGEKEIKKSVEVSYHCFKEFEKRKIEIKDEGEVFKISAYFSEKLSEVSAEAIYGKIITASARENEVQITYERKFKYPYKDIIKLKFHEDKIAFLYLTAYSYVEIPVQTEPFSKVEVKTKTEKFSKTADKYGNANIKVKISPEDKSLIIEAEDIGGNKTREIIPVEFPSINPEFFEPLFLGDKLVIFTNKKIKDSKLKKYSKHIYVFSPKRPGNYLLKIDGKEFKITKKNYPAFLSVDCNTNQQTIYADGTSEVVFSVKLTDIYGNEIKDLPDIEYNYPKDFITVKSKDGKISFIVKKKVSDTLKVELRYYYLRYSREFKLTPGPPQDIVVETNKSYVYGNGEDKVIILASLQDRAGNIIQVPLEATTQFGKIEKSKLHKNGISEFIYSANSKQNLESKISIRYGDFSKEINIRVLAKRYFVELSPKIGVLNNFGKIIIPSPSFHLSYARLFSGRYVYFTFGTGYFYTKIQDVSFNTIYFTPSLSTEIRTLKFGAGTYTFLQFVDSGDISESFFKVAPLLKFSYSIQDFLVELNILFPPGKQEKSFVVIKNSFERILFNIGYTFEIR